MQAVRDAIRAALMEDNPMTVRQVFYRLVSAGAIGKTEQEYKGCVVRLLTEMRLDGSIPFGWIADNTRWMRKPRTYDSVEQALQRTAETYRRALWSQQAVDVEVWLEKDALAGVLIEETDPWDVPLMVTRGYPSLSYLYEAASAIRAADKPTFIYYFGDLDPSGLDITRNVGARLRQFAPEADITFERVAVTPEQVTEYGLQTRPTKKTDSRSQGFEGESVEVDAIPPRTLRAIAASCIERHIDAELHNALMDTEAAERESLVQVAERWGHRLSWGEP